MILNEDTFDILNFDVPDVTNADIEVADIDATVPEAGPEVGVETLLMQAIKDIYGMIEGYNSLSIALTDIGNEPAAVAIADIIRMEHSNIGALQDILKEISPNAEAVDINESLNETYDRRDNFISDIYYNLIDLYKNIKNEYPDIVNSGTLINSTKKAIELISSKQDSLGLNESWTDNYKEYDDITKQVQKIVEDICHRFYAPSNSIEVYKDTDKDALKQYVINFAHCKGVYPEYWTNIQTTKDKKERVKAFYDAIMRELKYASKFKGLPIKYIGYDNHGRIKAITFDAK